MKRRNMFRLNRMWRLLLSIPALLIMVWFLTATWVAAKKAQIDPVNEFRMAERSRWMGPSDIQYAGDNYGAIGTYMDQVAISTGRDSLEYWPRDPEGPTLVPAGGKFVAVDVPKGTARAELTLELSFYYVPALSEPSYAGPTSAVREELERYWGKNGAVVLWQDTYVVQGKLTEEGGVLFRPEPKAEEVPGELGVWDGHPLYEVTDRDIYTQDPRDNMAWASMTAIFYDKAGAELGRASLNTPEGGASDSDINS